MIFSSLVFAQFFLVYLTAHILLPVRYRMLLIVVGSAYFYGSWNPAYTWLPFFLTLVAWIGAKVIDSERRTNRRQAALIGTLIVLLSPLAVYKYANFFVADVLGVFADFPDRVIDASLPLGISFITFTLISYVVDVYNRRFPVERSFMDLSAYVLFFPQLIAGPILRPRELLPQLHNQTIALAGYIEQVKRSLDARFVLGATIFAIGVVKKVIFADSFGSAIDPVFDSPDTVTSAWHYLLAIYGFSLQIYCDFSGYTDMAIGLGIMLRVRLPQNFMRPYTATSIVEFWRLWHITLSNWLRDYLYISLGGNRFGFSKQIRNVLITMGLGGLWHGASWNFVIWGLLHGIAISFVHMLRHFNIRLISLPRWIWIFLTFHFVTLTWVFFRAPDFYTARVVLAGPFVSSYSQIGEFILNNGFYLVLLGVFLLTHRFDKHSYYRLAVRRLPTWLTVTMVAWLLGLAMVMSHGSSAKFIYFDF